jgi:transposase
MDSYQRSGRRRGRSADEIAGIVERYVASGLTQRAFCAREGVGLSTLALWLRRRRRGLIEGARPAGGRIGAEKLAAGLVEVALRSPTLRTTGLGAWRYEVELGGEVTLRMAGGFDGGELRQLFAVLREAGR